MEAMTLEDRVLLALEWLALRYERRDGFLSESDIFEATEQYTTDNLEAADEAEEVAMLSDYSALFDALYVKLTGENA